MDPLTIAALAGAGTQSLGAIAQFGASIPAQIKNRGAIRDLEGRQRQGTLGLTGNERTAMQQALVAPQQRAAQSSQRNLDRKAAAGSAAGVGTRELLGSMQQASEAIGRAEGDARGQIAAADFRRARQQESELESRRALQQAYLRDLISGLTGGTGQAVSNISQALELQRIAQGVQAAPQPAAPAGADGGANPGLNFIPGVGQATRGL